jgi:hypothetical protein
MVVRVSIADRMVFRDHGWVDRMVFRVPGGARISATKSRSRHCCRRPTWSTNRSIVKGNWSGASLARPPSVPRNETQRPPERIGPAYTGANWPSRLEVAVTCGRRGCQGCRREPPRARGRVTSVLFLRHWVSGHVAKVDQVSRSAGGPDSPDRDKGCRRTSARVGGTGCRNLPGWHFSGGTPHCRTAPEPPPSRLTGSAPSVVRSSFVCPSDPALRNRYEMSTIPTCLPRGGGETIGARGKQPEGAKL